MKYFLDFELPENLIATNPSKRRDGDKIMVFTQNQINHELFPNIIKYLNSGDTLVFNNSKVFKARLDVFSLKSDVVSELLLIEQKSHNTWTAMIKKARRFSVGDFFSLSDHTKVKVLDVLEDGLRVLEFERNFSPEDANLLGQIPLPSYIIKAREKQGLELYTDEDEERYQTIFAKIYGSVAAPTASLRFTDEFIRALKQKNINIEEITLHVGIGTFKPMDTSPDDFEIHHEKITVSKDVIDRIHQYKSKGGRIIAVGTTVCRALETAGSKAFDGWTNIFIKPAYKFRVIDGLITNFHLPNSTLLLLVQAFIGVENTQKLYKEAINQHYRFYSYGDGMLLLP